MPKKINRLKFETLFSKMLGCYGDIFLTKIHLLPRSLKEFLKRVGCCLMILVAPSDSPETKQKKSVIRNCPKVLLDKVPNELNKRFESPMCTNANANSENI